MTRKRFSLSSTKRLSYAGVLLLHYMAEEEVQFPVLLRGDDAKLEPILQHLRKEGLVAIENGHFQVTEEGKNRERAFMARYSDFLRQYEVFQAVDLEAGEFAWSYYGQFDSQEKFQQFLQQERWEDLRIAVLEYENEKSHFKRNHLHPVEAVFLSFLQEKRFDFTADGWQEKLLSGAIWDEILTICNSMLQWRDLGEEDVIQDILEQGRKLTRELAE